MTGPTTGPGHDRERPLLRVLTPDATEEEVAALVAVVATLSSAAPAPSASTSRSRWGAPARGLRSAGPADRSGWRAAALPR